MEVILYLKKIFRNKYLETFFFGAIFIWVLIKTLKHLIAIISDNSIDIQYLFIELAFVCISLYLVYLFLDSYMRNFGLKSKADIAYKEGDYNLAIKKYSILLRIFRWNGHYYCDRGNCYYQMKNWNLAVNDYTKAIKLEPDVAYIYENRANAYKFMGFKTHAKEDIKMFKKLRT